MRPPHPEGACDSGPPQTSQRTSLHTPLPRRRVPSRSGLLRDRAALCLPGARSQTGKLPGGGDWSPRPVLPFVFPSAVSGSWLPDAPAALVVGASDHRRVLSARLGWQRQRRPALSGRKPGLPQARPEVISPLGRARGGNAHEPRRLLVEPVGVYVGDDLDVRAAWVGVPVVEATEDEDVPEEPNTV